MRASVYKERMNTYIVRTSMNSNYLCARICTRLLWWALSCSGCAGREERQSSEKKSVLVVHHQYHLPGNHLAGSSASFYIVTLWDQ